ncbi:MAG: (2Fe-2S)-binding protein [Burkholderiaceae bacterium]
MFKRLTETGTSVTFEFEGQAVQARIGDTVAGALLAHGVRTMRHAVVSGESRQPYCQIGVCFECLLEIDGRPNRQACMTRVADGMRVRRQAPLDAASQEASS